ncbi:MAG TPA: radical SAM family heme chaperone HemW, partial [Candidatus Manganitrophaceae bacterium]|nr:radical SAM family heme chaperone HemW [Candidatus Manganitrophaceae bacterium]
MKALGLYIDFPFCVARCAFCAFNIQGYRKGIAERYAAALRKEIALHAQTEIGRRSGNSVYFGGGTPTLYSPKVLNELLSSLREGWGLSDGVEATIEAHPATVDFQKLEALRTGGFNRLSMGAQSFSDQDLHALGRGHTAQEARDAFRAARAAGFTNIGIDLIYALPGQSIREWGETLQAAIDLAPEHLSVYGLSIEEGTLFHKKERAGTLSLPSDDEAVAFYRKSQDRLVAAGYRQYEISNFAKPGYACRHNLLYWDRGDALGIGLSAHSYIDGEHRANSDS